MDREGAVGAGDALTWIVGVISRHNVPYQVSGGLAARAYGAQRELADIDIYIPFDTAADVLKDVQPHVVRGPEHFVSDCWDITFVELDYKGQAIELTDSSSNPRVFNSAEHRWLAQRINYDASTPVEVLGTTVAVMPKDELIRYKQALARDTDLADIEEMAAAHVST